MNHFAFYLFAFSLGAFVVPILSRLVRLPAMIGEILYGMLLATFFFSETVNFEFIEFLSELGFIFLMFLAGLELNFDQLARTSLKRPLTALTLMYGFMGLLAYLGLIELNAFQLILVSACSVGVVFLGLKYEQEEQTEFGQQLIWIASLGELVTIFAMILFEVSHRQGDTMHIIKDISGLFLMLLLAYFFLRLIIYLFWRYPKAVFIFGKEKNVSELGVRLSFMVLMMMVALSAFFRLELILGAFIGGMMLSFAFRDKHALEEKLATIGYGFFTPFFFIKIGWDFDLKASDLSQIVTQGLILFGLILLVRMAPALVFLRSRSRYAWPFKIRQMFAAAFLWSAPLTLLVALGRVGLEVKLLTETSYNAIILCSMIGAIIGPLGYNLIRPQLPKN